MPYFRGDTRFYRPIKTENEKTHAYFQRENLYRSLFMFVVVIVIGVILGVGLRVVR